VSFVVAEVAIRFLRPRFPGFALPQVAHQAIAGVGYGMVPSQMAYTYAERVSINSHGFRGPEIRGERSPGDLRIICLGDSFTFGVGVSDEETYPRQLEDLLTKRWPGRRPEVINAGVQGYATYQEVDWLRSRGVEFDPDVVVLAVYFNDVVVRPSGDYTKQFEREQRQAAKLFRNRAPWLYRLSRNSALLSLLNGAALAARHGNSSSDILQGVESDQVQEQWRATQRELSTFLELSRQHGFKPLVITIPTRIQVVQEFPDSSYPARIRSICERLGIEMADVSTSLKAGLAEGVDPYLPWDNHLSAAGSRLVAIVIRDRLEKLLAE